MGKTREPGASISNKVVRILALLGSLPREPQRISTPELRSRLQSLGHDVDIRTVERYMSELESSQLFADVLVCDDRSKPYAWYIKRDKVLLGEYMEPSIAATWVLIDQYLHYLLPPAARQKLEPVVESARKWLKRNAAHRSDWSKKVVYIPRGMPLTPANVPTHVFDSVQKALFLDRQIEIQYGVQRQTMVVHPRAFVDRGVVSYMVASCWSYPDFRLFAMHRIKKVRVLDDKINDLPFSLQEYLPELELPHGQEINLKVRFYNWAGYHLLETPLTPEQKIEDIGDGCHEVRARVLDTSELRWWLQAFGANVEVLMPKALRKSIGEALREAASRYVS